MLDDQTALEIEVQLASVWALTDGKYGDVQVRHILPALLLARGDRPSTHCNQVTRSTGGDHSCRTNPKFSDDFWKAEACPFCDRKVDALVAAEKAERDSRRR